MGVGDIGLGVAMFTFIVISLVIVILIARSQLIVVMLISKLMVRKPSLFSR